MSYPIHRVHEEEVEDNQMNQIQRVMQIITAKDKMGQKVNRIYFPKILMLNMILTKSKINMLNLVQKKKQRNRRN